MRLKNKVPRVWNALPLFWKTYALSIILAVSVVFIGEGAEGLAQKAISLADISVKSNVREALLWLIAIIVSSLMGSLIISRVITGALTRIQPVVEHLANGDLDSRINDMDAGRGDEIGSLGRSFNRMADNISRLLESERTLIRDISHEMRSPLTRMKMALALLKQDATPSTIVEPHIEQLERDIDRMESMVGQMLERARLATMDQSGFEKIEFDLVAAVNASIVDHSLGAADGRKISFQGLSSAAYYGNVTLIRRAVDNLIKNALHYTAPESTVLVRLRSVSETFILDVIDQGPGVPDDHLESIFQPFYRVDSARTSGGGFGLGLSIARQAAQLHGGQVTAINIMGDSPTPSEAGRSRGLKVTLTLPANKPKTATA
ncbi:HAMP domain-containing histidine kinase [Deltaproteobacteria bacterium OttesenSCG-928-K17]|nr:HAMP domain-containing histidine kinase [Deltaproteobacteria bacterium OttesenSCG-928-K17]